MAGTGKSSAFFPTDVRLLTQPQLPNSEPEGHSTVAQNSNDESLRKHVLYLLKGGGAQGIVKAVLK